MIKSDRWIKRQCLAPEFVVTEMVPQIVSSHHDMYYPPKTQERAVHMTQDEIEKKIRERQIAGGSLGDVLGIIDYRQSTQQEKDDFQPMIWPYEPGNIRYKEEPISPHLQGTGMMISSINAATGESSLTEKKKILSYGTSSFGYDVTLSDEFRIFTNINAGIIDPLNFDEKCLHEHKGDVCIIPPNSYILGVTREYFRIPRNVMVVCVGKSTYARCGAIVNVTPIEPGFEGHVVIEISNATNLPMKIYANQGIAQFMFFESDEECETSYADKGGKYQGQTGVTLAKG